jgi:hypothetical protein
MRLLQQHQFDRVVQTSGTAEVDSTRQLPTALVAAVPGKGIGTRG